MTAHSSDDPPPYVTFEQLAEILRKRGIDPYATGSSVRHLARSRKDWPVGKEGEGKPYTYTRVSNARQMPTDPVIAYLRQNPPGGRGPDKEPRKSRGAQ